MLSQHAAAATNAAATWAASLSAGEQPGQPAGGERVRSDRRQRFRQRGPGLQRQSLWLRIDREAVVVGSAGRARAGVRRLPAPVLGLRRAGREAAVRDAAAGDRE